MIESAFTWLNEIINALMDFIPRRVIVRATHGGVKWRMWREPKELRPGIRIWWPLLSEIEVLVTARQTLNTPTQALMTRDAKQVVAGGVIIYSINDIVKAIGEKNWNVDTTVGDIAQTALVEVVTSMELDFILANIQNNVQDVFTESCRRQLRQYGVYVHKAAFTDFSTCKSINLLGMMRQDGL